MQVPNVNFQQAIQRAKDSLQATGEKTALCLKFLNNQADAFIKSKNKDPKAIKELALGGAITLGVTLLACSCVKSIFNKIKEIIKK